MTGDEIRNSFIGFFEDKGHLPMPSASLIPAGDPTLLFTSAGMVPFKPFFMGEQTPPNRRLTSSQKSFRTTDIDEVGDHKHLTFFEMLGNFSIGDYFKNHAVAYAWELATTRFHLPPESIYVTIHLDDDEAFAIWREEIGIPPERIYHYGDSDNWWGPAGAEGPTGPCSELHFDGGAPKGCAPLMPPEQLTAQFRRELASGQPETPPGCHPNCDCERFVELWNLVFMQFYQDAQGQRTPLPAPSVDTGMGLERAAAVLQDKPNVYETDLFRPIIDRAVELSGRDYGVDREADYALRVVAEHARAAAFLIGDGVVPGNEGRGYVLRRVIRRAIRYGRRLGLTQPFLTEVAAVVMDNFSAAYPELAENRNFIQRVIGLEEERFGRTIDTGLPILEDRLIPLHKKLETFGDRWDSFIQRIQEPVYTYADGRPRVEMSMRAKVNVLINLFTGEISQIQQGESDEASRILFRTLLESPAGVALQQSAREVSQSRENLLGLARIHLAESRYIEEICDFLRGLTIPDGEAVNQFLIDVGMELRRRCATLPSETVFILYDTYGFPPELTAEIAREQGLEVDLPGFEGEMARQREQSRAAQGFSGGMEMLTAYENLGVGPSNFVGYTQLNRETVIAALLVDNEPVGHAVQGQAVELVLADTPFYAESGGQVGDQGIIAGPNGIFRVADTQSPVAGLIVHKGIVESGDISLGEPVSAQVDAARRMDAARHHSGTHLLHAALRSVLGPHVRQAGSLVSPDRLRFDFSHVGPLSPEEQLSVQGLANGKVRENLIVSTQESTYAAAVREGALAFFGDKYGDTVRVVRMADDAAADNAAAFSMEVCGGTHVHATGQVGTLFVLGESGIGGGMRRIEAVTGRAAEQLFLERTARLESLARKLQTPVVDLESRLDSFMQDTDDLRRRLAALERGNLRAEAEALLAQAQDIDGVTLIAGRTSANGAEGMREMGDFLKTRHPANAVIALGAVVNGNPLLVTMVTADLTGQGIHAGNIAREAARLMGGGGGGQPEMAQAGGRDAAQLDNALRRVADLVRQARAG